MPASQHRQQRRLFVAGRQVGIPAPALLRTEKLVKKARKAGLLEKAPVAKVTRQSVAQQLFALAAQAQARGWSAEALLLGEAKRRERALRRVEKKKATP